MNLTSRDSSSVFCAKNESFSDNSNLLNSSNLNKYAFGFDFKAMSPKAHESYSEAQNSAPCTLSLWKSMIALSNF